jgi:hypothetical protein
MFLTEPHATISSISKGLDVVEKALRNWTTMHIPSRVIPNLKHRQHYGWVIDLVLEHGNDNYVGLLDSRVEWVYNQLKDWPDCKRTAWDMWRFKSKRDAEKFITLYTLTWAQ